MAIALTIDDTTLEIPETAAALLADELNEYANGYRGDTEDPGVARELAEALQQRLNSRAAGPLIVNDDAPLEALHRALNAIVDVVGPTMELFNVVDMTRRAS